MLSMFSALWHWLRRPTSCKLGKHDLRHHISADVLKLRCADCGWLSPGIPVKNRVTHRLERA